MNYSTCLNIAVKIRLNHPAYFFNSKIHEREGERLCWAEVKVKWLHEKKSILYSERYQD